MRILCASIPLALGVAAAQSGAAAPSMSSETTRTRVVPCSESIDGTKFPYIGGYKREHRYRLVLGTVSVPPAYREQIVRNGTEPWLYFFKAGLVVRASGESVVVTVPKIWQNRAAIAWGYGGKGVFSSLRLAGCKASPTEGFAYSGGFYVKSAPACVPLTFRVGRRSAKVQFGLGRRCR